MELPNHSHVQAAIRDLNLRTLSQLSVPLAKLLYLAGLRDYNTGMYHHEGLASRYSEEAACEALADCHRQAFHDLLTSSLEETVQQLESYMTGLGTSPGEFFSTWNSLKPYQVAVPAGTNSLSAEFLSSNLKVALAILESRFQARRPASQSASPRL